MSESLHNGMGFFDPLQKSHQEYHVVWNVGDQGASTPDVPQSGAEGSAGVRRTEDTPPQSAGYRGPQYPQLYGRGQLLGDQQGG